MYRLYVSFILFFIKMVPRDAECAGSRGPIGGQADRHFPHSVIVSHTCHILCSSVQDIPLAHLIFHSNKHRTLTNVMLS